MPEIPSKFASSSSVIEFGSQKAAAISTSLRKWPLGTKGADVVGRLRVSSYVRRLPDYGGQVPRSRISEYRASHGAPRRKRGKPASLSRLLAGRPKPCPALKRDCLALFLPTSQIRSALRITRSTFRYSLVSIIHRWSPAVAGSTRRFVFRIRLPPSIEELWRTSRVHPNSTRGCIR